MSLRLPIALALSLAAAPCAPLTAADTKAAAPPDLSRAMILVEASPKFPGAKHQTGGSFLEKKGGITAETAQADMVRAMRDPRNFRPTPGSFTARIVGDQPAREAMSRAEADGIGAVMVLTVLRRDVMDLGSLTFQVQVDCSVHTRSSANHSWKRVFQRKLVGKQPRDVTFTYYPTDCAEVAKQVQEIFSELMLKQAVRFKHKSISLPGTEKFTDAPPAITATVTNHTQRTIQSLQLSIPPTTRGAEATTITSRDPVPPGKTVDVNFSIPNEPRLKTAWRRSSLTSVGFESGGPAAEDDRPRSLLELLRERQNKRAGQL